MNLINKKFFLFSDLETISGVGKKISTYLKKKRIEKVSDLLWDLPYSLTDRSQISTLDKLEVGKIFTIKVKVKKHNFPRIRNLPNKILCKDNFGEIDLIFFNSREGYIRKILPLNEWVVVSGKINYFRNKYQITNPTYLSKEENLDDIKTIIPKYSLTEGLKEKTYRNIIEKVINQIPEINEWHDDIFVKKMNFLSWKESIKNLHNPNIEKDLNSIFLKRIAYDEIFANLIFLSNNRNKIKKIKKKFKKFKGIYSDKLIKSLPYMLTNGQKKVISEINQDLKSNLRMFRILQGDVGSGKTIIAKIVALNSIESGYQCGLMAPTSILAEQHFKLLNKLIIDSNLKIKIKLITGKTDLKERKKILQDLENKRIDVLLMSATPIPRTMMMSIYGDMDTSRLEEKPKHRQKILTLSKPENKINELWPFIEKRIKNGEQIFWVCPLIEDSKKLDFSSTAKMFKLISKKFPKKVGLIHGALDQNEKDKVLNKFLKNEISILVSTTVIEVGVDFPNATVIIIENSNKFGLAQLHQLRGRIGRGDKSGTCILLYKNQLSQNAKKRILILKSSDDGFYIAEEDLKLRGFGDLIGYQQSGIKNFHFADPVIHEDLFKLAEQYVKKNQKLVNQKKFSFLLKLFDKAEIINVEEI